MDNMLVGPAVDEVASWYEAVEWVGAILTPKASFYYQGEDYPGDSVIEYVVPLTKGGRYTMNCVNWFGTINDEKDLLRSFRFTGSVVTPDVAPKYLNTVEFFRYIRKLKESRRIDGKWEWCKSIPNDGERSESNCPTSYSYVVSKIIWLVSVTVGI